MEPTGSPGAGAIGARQAQGFGFPPDADGGISAGHAGQPSRYRRGW